MTEFRPVSGDELRETREAAGLTQARLAERLRVSQRTIVSWESPSGAGVPTRRLRRVYVELGDVLRMVRGEQQAPAPARHDPAERRRAGLSEFSDTDLLDELRRRATHR